MFVSSFNVHCCDREMFVNHMGVGRVAFGHSSVFKEQHPSNPQVDNGCYCTKDDGDGNTSHTPNGGNQCSLVCTNCITVLFIGLIRSNQFLQLPVNAVFRVAARNQE